MYRYAYPNLFGGGLDDASLDQFDNAIDLLAQWLTQLVGTLIKRGLHREYVEAEESLAGLRGQLKLDETLRQTELARRKLVCAFDDFSVDSPHNQALKSVMRLLLDDDGLEPKHKDDLRKTLLYFREVTAVPPGAVRWDTLRCHRYNASYRTLLEICQFAVQHLRLTTDDGTEKLSRQLPSKGMDTTYEKFVLGYYKEHHSGLSPEPLGFPWNIAKNGNDRFLPRMKTDITMSSGNKTLIIDTKFCQQVLNYSPSHGGKKIFRPEDLYQILAYVKNCQAETKRDVRGVLLYAKTESEIDNGLPPDNGYELLGSQISIKTLDLGQDWKTIEKRLNAICDWLVDAKARSVKIQTA
jgi:5-methylcytosine-specific restriction enzyme subunit McrC